MKHPQQTPSLTRTTVMPIVLGFIGIVAVIAILMINLQPPQTVELTDGAKQATQSVGVMDSVTSWFTGSKPGHESEDDPTQSPLGPNGLPREQEEFYAWLNTQAVAGASSPTPTTDEPAKSKSVLDSIMATLKMSNPQNHESDPPPLRKPYAIGGAGILSGPNGVCVDRSGMIYVADTGHNRIQTFYPDMTPGPSWGEKGSKPGQLQTPVDLACGNDGLIYVADLENHRIQAFQPNGKLDESWGKKGIVEIKNALPFGLGTDSLGFLYVADAGSRQVIVLDGAGSQINNFTDAAVKSVQDLQVLVDGSVFVADQSSQAVHKFIDNTLKKTYRLPSPPRAIAMDREELLYVALMNGDILQMSANGDILQTWKPTDKSPWNGPTGLSLWRNRLYVVSQVTASVWAFTP